MTIEEQIKKTIANIQEEFALSYSNMARHLKKASLPMSVIADYANVSYDVLKYPNRGFSDANKKHVLKEIKKINIDKLAKRFLMKSAS